MTDFNELKGAVISTLGTVAEKTRTFAEKASDKAKDVTRIAKLGMELNSEKDAIQKTYTEIGKLYYETAKGSPDSFFVQLFDEIALACENIDRLKAEIEELKSTMDPRTCKECCVEVEFEVISPEDAPAQVPDEDLLKDEPQATEEKGGTPGKEEEPLPEQPAE